MEPIKKESTSVELPLTSDEVEVIEINNEELGQDISNGRKMSGEKHREMSKETQIIFNEYKKGWLNGLEKFVPDKMLDDLCIAGTPDLALKKLKEFRNIGINLPIIQFNPIGNVKESFELLTNTFSGELNE